ncbi:MAG: MFS transporter, partial [Pseudonocardiaceae bacterium]
VQALRGAAGGFYLPAAAGLLPQIVARRDLGRANAIVRITKSSTLIVGAGCGGLLVGFLGPTWGLVADGMSYAVAGGLRWFMRLDGVGPAPKRTILTDLRTGWSAFVSRTWLWVAVLQLSAVAAFFQSTMNVLGPILTSTSYDGPKTWGFLTMASGLGAVVGGLIIMRFPPRRLLLWGCVTILVIPVYFLALALMLPAPVLLVLALFAGAANEPMNIGLDTAIQSEIPPHTISRVSAYDQLGGYGLAPVGVLIAGPLVAAFGIEWALAVCGVTIIVITVAALCVPDIRRLERAHA